MAPPGPTRLDRSSRSRLLAPLVVLFLIVGVGAVVPSAEEGRPDPGDIAAFAADPIAPAPSEHFKAFKITRVDLETILTTYHQVGEEHWKHGYSHVAFADRTGHVTLKDGRTIRWLVRPGGLAWLQFPGGTRLYLAAEKTEWPVGR